MNTAEGTVIAEFVDAYEVLGVPPDASDETVAAARRRLLRHHHPDVVPPVQRNDATRTVQAINVAYGLIRDPAKRRDYDRVRQAYLAGRRIDAHWELLLGRAARWAGRQWARHGAPLPESAYRMGWRLGRWLSGNHP